MVHATQISAFLAGILRGSCPGVALAGDDRRPAGRITDLRSRTSTRRSSARLPRADRAASIFATIRLHALLAKRCAQSWESSRGDDLSSLHVVHQLPTPLASDPVKISQVIGRPPRLFALLLAAAVRGGVALPATRQACLRAAGWALVAEEALPHGDIIVVGIAADGAGVLEAADLFHAGVAARVAVFADPPDPIIDREFLRRGAPYEDEAARSVRQLRSLGVANIETIPARFANGTEAEGPALRGWCDENRFDSVVLVTTADHSRRLSRVLRRAMKGQSTRVAVRVAHHSTFDPDRWWETRGGSRIEIIEMQKLLLDIVLHPFS